MSEESKPSFTVKDRRHFTSEGDVRSGGDAREPSARESQRNEAGRPAGAAVQEPAGGPAEATRIPTDLVGLLVTLATQGSLLLSPEAGPDLPAARDTITLIETLGEKTRGNRTPEEDRLLDEILYQLRMAYMSVAQAART